MTSRLSFHPPASAIASNLDNQEGNSSGCAPEKHSGLRNPGVAVMLVVESASAAMRACCGLVESSSVLDNGSTSPGSGVISSIFYFRIGHSNGVLSSIKFCIG